MTDRREIFSSPDLSKIIPGTSTLGVPTFRDILQIAHIHTNRDNAIARLELTRQDDELLIARQDGRPIQVWINDYSYHEEDPSGMNYLAGSVEVFREPITSFSFEHEGGFNWRVTGEGVETAHIARVKRLAATIGDYAVEKQEKAIKRALEREGYGV
ncbi:MAG: hypothetical protein ABIP50_03355 [Candidatus Saccharimonadales bacterium]